MPSDEVKVACWQMAVEPGGMATNLSRVKDAVRQAYEQQVSLLALPEMWSSAFDYSQLQRAAAETPRILEELCVWCRKWPVIIVGSLPEAADGRIFNTSYVIVPPGRVAGSYRKMHLFTLLGEHRHFARGTNPVVCHTEIGGIAPLICYDLRFPELARSVALAGARILCFSALWPAPRIEHWRLLLQARALENQCFAVGCNGCGREGTIRYGGHSMIVDPLGTILAEAGEEETMITATLRWEVLESFRRQIPCFEDRHESYDGVVVSPMPKSPRGA